MSLNLIDEIKLALWVKQLPNQLKGESKMGNFVSNLLAKIDGLKSVAGLLMVVGYYVGPQFGISVPDVVLKSGAGLASVGLAMKLEKGLGVLTAVISYAGKALNVLQAVVNALAPKQPAN